MRDLLRDPAWREEDLGFPLPDSPHACLVSLPTWEAVIGYEESAPQVVERMRAGYPRFFIHPFTRQCLERLEAKHAGEGERAMAYSSERGAERAAEFVARQAGVESRVRMIDGLPVLLVPETGYQAARDYWRHTGELISSRQAEDWLAGTPVGVGEVAGMRTSLAAVLEVDPRDCFLFESGMAAIFTLHRVITKRSPGKKTLQFCFPYVDALKIQEHFGVGVDFVNAPRGEVLTRSLEAIAEGEYSAVFCEVPSNPLLRTVDLKAVSDACRKSGTPLLVDDTVCSHLNVDTLSLADAVSTSLTKWVSGVGDVMAGSIKINRESALAGELRAALDAEMPDGVRVYPRDGAVLASNAQGLGNLVSRANEGGEAVAEFLQNHSAVEQVWYPKCVDRAEYDALRRDGGGYGGLVSFTLRRPERAPDVYRAMRFCKGPSLGTEYSLICPYTLLAHYTETDWARECGVATELLRLSVGKEPVAELLERLTEALASG